jgi:uncharacterized SAM-binding protein YcdF (DUF218 family)
MKAIKIIFICAGGLALANFAVLFLTSNVHFGHYLLGFLAATFLLYGVFFEKLPRKIHIAIWAACSVPAFFTAFLMLYGTRSHVDFTEDAVIVLGAGLRGDEVGSHLVRRLDTAAAYLKRNPNAVVVVSGGLGAGRTITEAEAMYRYLVALDVPSERILLESASTSTHENLLFSREILAVRFPDGFRAVVVSNNFHIFRATQMARTLGIDAVALGAPMP